MRYIGIQHRVKRSKEGEERPTMVAIRDGDFVTEHELKTEQDELDFVLGRFPTAWRVVEEGEDISQFPKHHLRERGKDEEKTIRVPVSYEGFRAGDSIGMVLGGSGDYLACALSRQAEKIGGGSVMRIPPNRLKAKRGEVKKDRDHDLLMRFVKSDPDLFYPVTRLDRDSIRVRGSYQDRVEAQKARIASENRLRQRFIGQIFLSEDGLYPEGALEDAFKERKANDVIVSALSQEEKRADKEMREAVRRLNVWREIFSPIEGMGEAIAAGIIAPIVDIRRFSKASKLVAYCGVHVLPDGTFPRKRRGTVANWDDAARQALYLFSDQCVYRKDGKWGKYLRATKIRFRERHPVVEITEKGKKRYTDIHIHKMGVWRTLTRFTEWLWREWTRLENDTAASKHEGKKQDEAA